MNRILIAIVLALLMISGAYAEPEPSLGFRISQFFDGFDNTLSIQSSYQSFVRWNTNTDQCIYFTGILNSVSSRVVDSSHCSLRTYTKEYKTLSDVDQKLFAEQQNNKVLVDVTNQGHAACVVNKNDGNCYAIADVSKPGHATCIVDKTDGYCYITKSGGSTSSGLGRIGDKCTTAQDCGLTCEGRDNNCEPRCLDGGPGKDGIDGRSCFAGTGTDQTGYLFSSTCGRSSDCATGEQCVAGICTQADYDSGNPPIVQSDGSTTQAITPEDICRTTDCTTKCDDGTAVFTCSEKSPSKYCFKEGNNGVLKDYAGLCGCPEGQRPDFYALKCCDPAANTCFNCQEGEIKTRECSDGTEIVAVTCGADGEWEPTEAACPIDEDDNSAVAFILVMLAIIAGSILIVGGLYATWRYFKK